MVEKIILKMLAYITNRETLSLNVVLLNWLSYLLSHIYYLFIVSHLPLGPSVFLFCTVSYQQAELATCISAWKCTSFALSFTCFSLQSPPLVLMCTVSVLSTATAGRVCLFKYALSEWYMRLFSQHFSSSLICKQQSAVTTLCSTWPQHKKFSNGHIKITFSVKKHLQPHNTEEKHERNLLPANTDGEQMAKNSKHTCDFNSAAGYVLTQKLKHSKNSRHTSALRCVNTWFI